MRNTIITSLLELIQIDSSLVRLTDDNRLEASFCESKISCSLETGSVEVYDKDGVLVEKEEIMGNICDSILAAAKDSYSATRKDILKKAEKSRNWKTYAQY